MNGITLNKVNHFILRKQHLTDDAKVDDVVQIARDITGLHATGVKEPYLALFARTRNFAKEQLDGELYLKRTLGRIRCMRGTLYILPKEMIPIAHAATRGMVEKLSRRYAEFRGISEMDYLDVSKSILSLLKGGEMSVSEIKTELNTRLNLSAVLNLMCDQGLLVRIQAGKSWKVGNYRYTPFREFFTDINLTQFSELEAVTLLVKQYLSSFGPATEGDITWWLRLNKTKVREALDRIKDNVTRLDIPNLKGEFIVLRSDLNLLREVELTGKPTVNLLPTLDPYLMGYKQRERYLDYKHYDKTFDRSGNATSTILVDGRTVGVWDFLDSDVEPEVKVCLLEEVTEEILQQIYSKALEIGKFISGTEVKFRKVSSMVSLREMPAGAFMSPLKNSQE